MALTPTQKNSAQLRDAEESLVDQVVAAENMSELQTQLALFNTNQAKKNILRLARLGGVLDKVDDQLIERLEKRPDQIPTKEIIEIMNAVSSQMDRINDFNAKLGEAGKPAITAIGSKTEINVNVTPSLTRDERAGVADAVAAILAQLKRANAASVAAYPDIVQQEAAENVTNSMYTEDNILNSEE